MKFSLQSALKSLALCGVIAALFAVSACGGGGGSISGGDRPCEERQDCLLIMLDGDFAGMVGSEDGVRITLRRGVSADITVVLNVNADGVQSSITATITAGETSKEIPVGDFAGATSVVVNIVSISPQSVDGVSLTFDAAARYTITITPAGLPDPPAAPTALTPTAASATAIDLTWTWDAAGGEDATSFLIYRGSRNDFNITTNANATITVSDPADTSRQDTGLTPDNTYYYRIVAVGDGGASDPFPAATVAASFTATPAAPPGAPDAPAGLSVGSVSGAGSAGRVPLTWTKAASLAAADYRVYRRERTSADGAAAAYSAWARVADADLATAVNCPAACSATDAPGAGIYQYAARAFENGLESGNSNTVDATVQLATPVNLAADIEGQGAAARVTISWDAVDDADGYRIYRGAASGFTPTDSGANANRLTDSDETNEEFVDTTHGGEGTYYYKVIAYATGKAALDSAESSAQSAVVPAAAPDAPAGLTAGSITGAGADGRVPLTWTKAVSLAAADYRVYRRERTSADGAAAAYSAWARVADADLETAVNCPADCSATDAPGAGIYQYAVRAFENGLESGNSNVVDATVKLATPVILAADIEGQGAAARVTITWDAVSDADGYRIYRGTTSGFTPAAGNRLTDSDETNEEFVDTTHGGEGTYYYKVIAYATGKAALDSAESSAQSADVPSALPPPNAPTALPFLTAASDRAIIQVTWQRGGGEAATAFRVYYSASPFNDVDADGVESIDMDIAGLGRAGDTYGMTITGLLSGTTYHFRIAAINSGGASAPFPALGDAARSTTTL